MGLGLGRRLAPGSSGTPICFAPGGQRLSNPSSESSEEHGLAPSRSGFLARMKFSSPGMLTAEREPTEYMTISLTDPC